MMNLDVGTASNSIHIYSRYIRLELHCGRIPHSMKMPASSEVSHARLVEDKVNHFGSMLKPLRHEKDSRIGLCISPTLHH